MASLAKLIVPLMFTMPSLFITLSSSSPSLSSTRHPQFNPFLRDLNLQCPATIAISSPIEMDGESLDTLLSSYNSNAYTAILFYASWCPFSNNMQPKFHALASMYPQIKHVKIDQSSSLPSVFSRNGIHSVPTILIANKTSRIQYHGPKDLPSHLDFYKSTTGLAYEVNFTEEDELDSLPENSTRALCLWKNLNEDPYLVVSLLFVLLKLVLCLCPNIASDVMSLWVACVPRLNLAIFGESKQLLTHTLHLFDVKSAFSKLKLSKSGNFHNGARSARVFASSLASVSLGETSTVSFEIQKRVFQDHSIPSCYKPRNLSSAAPASPFLLLSSSQQQTLDLASVASYDSYRDSEQYLNQGSRYTGRDKGKIGEIIKIVKHNSTVIVKEINLKTKHLKSKEEGESGQIVKIEAAIHSSNVMLYSKEQNVASRVGHKTLENGKRVRYLLKTGEVIDSEEVWKKVIKERERKKEEITVAS